MRRRRAIELLAVCLLVRLLFPPAPAHSASSEWSTIAEGKLSYTTDAFQFAAARRLALSEDPSQPTVVPLQKPEDVIWEPSVEVLRSSPTRLGPTELSFKAHGYLYTDKPIFNHGNYRVQVKQALGAGTAVLLRYRYVPNLFLGPNFERRTGTGSVQDERLTGHKWRVELERSLSETWLLTFIGRYGLRLYNDLFAERDTRFWTAGPKVEFRAAPWATVTLAYLFERGLADGRGDTRFNDDVSYRLHHVTVGTEFGLSRLWWLNLVYVHQRKDFTSDLVGDTHRDRQDLVHQGLAEVRYRLGSDTDLTFAYLRTQRTSTNALRDFTDTIVSLGAQYRF